MRVRDLGWPDFLDEGPVACCSLDERTIRGIGAPGEVLVFGGAVDRAGELKRRQNAFRVEHEAARGARPSHRFRVVGFRDGVVVGVLPYARIPFVDVDVAGGINRDAAWVCVAVFFFGGYGFDFRQQISIDVEAVGGRRIAGFEAGGVDVEAPLSRRAGVVDSDLRVRDRVAVVVGEAEVEPADFVRAGGGEHVRLESFSAAPVPVVAGNAAGPVLNDVEVSRGLIQGQAFRRRQGPAADVGVEAVDERRL